MNDRSTSSRRRPRLSRGKIAIAVAAVALAGYGAYKYFAGGEEEPEYIYAEVYTGDIEDLVTATGTLEPRDKVDVGAQVSGQIERIMVEVGDQVKAGDILAEIDATTATARVEANRASLRAQESNLMDRYNTLEKAERDYTRQKNLQAAGASTEEQLLNAETTLKSARQGIESLKLQIEQQKASMRVEEANLQYTTIKAPIDGTVVSIAAKQGQTINATQSAPTILTIADLNTMTVRAEVSEADYGKLSNGMPAYFTTLGGNNRRWEGTLKRVEPTPKVQNSVVLYYALFDVQNDSLQLMPSMTAQVFFVSAEARNVLVVPMAALQQGQQIMRERMAAQGERAEGGVPGNGPGGAPGGAPAGANAGSAPPAAAMAQNGAAPGGATAPAAGDGAAAGLGAAAGNGPRGEVPGRGERGGAGGPRQGGGFGGFNGGQPPTPEQIERMRQMRAQGGGGFGGFAPGGMGGPGGVAGRGRQQNRRGTVMVLQADGSLEPRQVVIGVTDRVHGEVLEGLTEGEEVVVGRRDVSAAAEVVPAQNNQGNRGQGGFPGGGGFRPF